MWLRFKLCFFLPINPPEVVFKKTTKVFIAQKKGVYKYIFHTYVVPGVLSAGTRVVMFVCRHLEMLMLIPDPACVYTGQARDDHGMETQRRRKGAPKHCLIT